MSVVFEAAIAKWQYILGKDQVLSEEQASNRFGQDTSGTRRRIPAALCPTERAQIPAIIKIAHQSGVSIYPLSTGNNWGYGTSYPVTHDCIILDLSRLNKITDFDAELGVVTVEPGVTQGMLSQFLTEGGHEFLVPVTGAGPNCSLLGNALERGYGITPYTDHFGAVTDLEAVLADGSTYRSALREAGAEDVARLFKWGVGPYLNGLFTQSGFGVVTQMSILLARRPENTKICLFSLSQDEQLEVGVAKINLILRTLPGIVGATNLMNQHRMLSMAAPYPREQLDSAGLIPTQVIRTMGSQYQIQPWTGFITLYGKRRIVSAAQKEITNILKSAASRVLFFSNTQAQYLARFTRYIPGATGLRLASTATTLAQSLALVNGYPNETALPLAYWRNPNAKQGPTRDPARDGCGLIWYAPLLPMRPNTVRLYVTMVQRITRKYGIEPLITLTSISDKVLDSTVPILFNTSNPIEVEQAQCCYQALLDEGAAAGFIPYRVGVTAMPWLTQRFGSAAELHTKLRRAIDPANSISPGRYL